MRIPYLFRKYDSFGVIQNRIEQIKKAVNQIDSNRLTDVEVEQLAEELTEEFDLAVPVLGEPYVAAHEEKQIDVRNDPMRLVFDRSRPCYVRGTRTVIRVPFTGNAQLFDVQPSTYNLNPPYGNVVGNEIEMEYDRTDNNGEALKAAYESNLRNINEYLTWLRQSFASLREQLKRTATNGIGERKKHLVSSSDMLSALNLPIHKS